MKYRTICMIVGLALLSACAPKTAPDATTPSGTWSGDYGPDSERRDSVTLDLRWDKTTLRGTVHAGPRSLDVSQALFKPDTGAITIQFDADARQGTSPHHHLTNTADLGKLLGHDR